MRALIQHAAANLLGNHSIPIESEHHTIGAPVPNLPPAAIPATSPPQPLFEYEFASANPDDMQIEPTARKRAEELAQDSINELLAMNEHLRLYDTSSEDGSEIPPDEDAPDMPAFDEPLMEPGVFFQSKFCTSSLINPQLTSHKLLSREWPRAGLLRR